MNASEHRVLLCYVPGLDLRRIDELNAPFLARAIESRPFAELLTLPSSELLSTVITGQMPHENGIWQTKLRPRRRRTRRERLVDSLSDIVTTTAQCVRHQLAHDCDIPSLPPRRRRELELHRIKFRGRVGTEELVGALDGASSIVDVVGARSFRYHFTDRIHDRDRLLRELPHGDVALEMLQFHAMDALGHWRLETAEEFRRYYGLTDAFLSDLSERCRERGVRFVLLSDHGQEPVTESFDLAARLEGLSVPRDEYAYFLQAIMARFWFHTDRAAREVLDLLARLHVGTTLSNERLAGYGIEFPDDGYGAAYFIANPGVVFFPNDFHHPLVNVVMGLKDWQQRKRLRNPRHLAYHGYLPENPSEKGFLVLFDEGASLSSDTFHLRDVAPTVLEMLGHARPDFMSGTSRLAG